MANCHHIFARGFTLPDLLSPFYCVESSLHFGEGLAVMKGDADVSCSRLSWRLGFREALVCLGLAALCREPAEASLVKVMAVLPEICIDTQNQYMQFKGLYILSRPSLDLPGVWV